MTIPTDVITTAPSTRLACEAWYWEFLTEAEAQHGPAGRREAKRLLIKGDLYYLLRYACGRDDMSRDWLFDRCREVQYEPDEWLDLWARDHYKSTIITFGLTILDILNDPEITICFLSHTGDIAKAFLLQIKRELETNDELKSLFSDILYADPTVESPKWSEDEGIIVKRKSNPKEPTLMSSGLVDGMPTGMHFKLRVYDDVVTDKSIGVEMIQKTTQAWSLSDNLGMRGGHARYIGTPYAKFDTYHEMHKRGIRERRHPATDDGAETGNPVLLTLEELAAKRRKQGPFTFGCQMLLNPLADKKKGFLLEWLTYHNVSYESAKATLNRYILVDPASSKKKTSDYTVMVCLGVDGLENYYLLDMIRDRLNLSERAEALLGLHRKWRPLGVGYEKYGSQSDVEYIQERMELINYRFHIEELGGRVRKEDRILGMVPYCEQRRFLLPETGIYRTNYEGIAQNLIKIFIEEEYEPYPVVPHDDIWDAIARIRDEKMMIEFPEPEMTAKPSWKDTLLRNAYEGTSSLDFLTR